jgi:hypothetical protein
MGQFDLVILGKDGNQISFEAAAISKQPDLDLSGEKMPFGEVDWKAFVHHRKRLDSANAFYIFLARVLLLPRRMPGRQHS